MSKNDIKDNLDIILDDSSNLSLNQIRRLLSKMTASEIAHALESSPPKQRTLLFSLLKIIKVLFFFIIFILSPINSKSSIIVKISFTNGIFSTLVLFARIEAAKIGKVAFFDPETLITPDKIFLPLTINFCIN